MAYLSKDISAGSIAHLRPRCLLFSIHVESYSWNRRRPKVSVQFLDAASNFQFQDFASRLASSIPSLELVLLSSSGCLPKEDYSSWWIDKGFQISHAGEDCGGPIGVPQVVELSEEAMYKVAARENLPMSIESKKVLRSLPFALNTSC